MGLHSQGVSSSNSLIAVNLYQSYLRPKESLRPATLRHCNVHTVPACYCCCSVSTACVTAAKAAVAIAVVVAAEDA